MDCIDLNVNNFCQLSVQFPFYGPLEAPTCSCAHDSAAPADVDDSDSDPQGYDERIFHVLLPKSLSCSKKLPLLKRF